MKMHRIVFLFLVLSNAGYAQDDSKSIGNAKADAMREVATAKQSVENSKPSSQVNIEKVEPRPYRMEHLKGREF